MRSNGFQARGWTQIKRLQILTGTKEPIGNFPDLGCYHNVLNIFGNIGLCSVIENNGWCRQLMNFSPNKAHGFHGQTNEDPWQESSNEIVKRLPQRFPWAWAWVYNRHCYFRSRAVGEAYCETWGKIREDKGSKEVVWF